MATSKRGALITNARSAHDELTQSRQRQRQFIRELERSHELRTLRNQAISDAAAGGITVAEIAGALDLEERIVAAILDKHEPVV